MTAARAVIGGVERHLSAWRPSPFKLRAVKPAIDLAALPVMISIDGFPTDFDQGQLGSCGPNSVAEVYAFNHPGKRFSRLFLYFFTRATEGDFWDDDGVTIPDLIAVAHTMGMPLESSWEYDIAKFAVPPPIAAIGEAQSHKIEQSDVIADLDHVLYEVARNQPVTFGFQVPASMQDGSGSDTARTGVIDLISDTNPSIGGHCVNAIGADRARRLVKTTSHYGPTYGDGGCLWLPFEYFERGLAMDPTAIRAVS